MGMSQQPSIKIRDDLESPTKVSNVEEDSPALEELVQKQRSNTSHFGQYSHQEH